MTECFFCFRNNKLTRAHLFQATFREALEIFERNVYLTSASVSNEGINRSISYPGDMRFAHVTSLCEECNSKWMQSIEIAAAPVFVELIKGERIPPPEDMLKLAQWAIVVSALSSELHPSLEIPDSHRRAIRGAAGLPEDFSTFVTWTSDYMSSVQADLYRAKPLNQADSDAYWINVLHAGSTVLISTSPGCTGRVARILQDAHVETTLGFLGEENVYIPQGFHAAARKGTRPSHEDMHDLGPKFFSEKLSFTTAPNGTEVINLPERPDFANIDMSFDFTGRVHSHRNLPSQEER